MAIQQMLLGVGAKDDPVYIDQIFSTDVYLGDATNNRSIVNNIDLATEGGLVLLKKRGNSAGWVACDTVTGANKQLETNTSAAQTNLTGTENNYLTAFNTNGFVIGDANKVNEHSGMTHAAWTWRRAPGFFDCVQFTGDGNTSQQISHSLKCVPGMVIVKCTSETMSWAVYHRTRGNTKGIYLNGVGPGDTNSGFWNNTSPTSTHFTVSDADPDAFTTNKDGATYVAYLFAGGDSTAATAGKSVALDGNDYLSVGSSSDYSMGTGDFTVECWAKSSNTSNKGFFQISSTSGGLQQSNYWQTIAAAYNGSQWACYGNGTFNTIHTSSNETFETDTWYHIAYVRSSGTSKLYVNGVEKISFSDTYDYDGTDIAIGSYYSSGQAITGNISNFRVVKGTALYTAPFTVPDTPLTSTTNTKLLCCNNSSVTGSTVASGTITSTGDPAASTDSPVFDDDAAHIFGESGSESVIKCGSYVGSGSAGLEVNLGWEPQLLIIKRSSGTEDWMLFDNIRTSDRTDMHLDDLRPNKTNAEGDGAGGDSNSYLNWTSTGFKLQSNTAHTNDADDTYIFCAVRRSDGYVGKPVELGTDVFAMDTGSSSSTIPAMDSSFVVDMALYRKPDTAYSWHLPTRLTGTKQLYVNNTSAEGTDADLVFDSNVGWAKGSTFGSDQQSWMWKRHAGFDVVTYGDGTSAARQIPHSLSKVPEMIWVKKRDSVEDWAVYHKGLNGGSSPEDYYLNLNSTNAEVDASSRWNDTAPTATHFTVGTSASVNGTNGEYLAMLFASTDVSKVGSYVGNDSGSNREISLGFQPRFLILMLSNSGGGYGWYVFDTKRGWASGSNNAPYLKLESNAAQSDEDHMYPTSNGFMITENAFNGANQNWIYYAHA